MIAIAQNCNFKESSQSFEPPVWILPLAYVLKMILRAYLKTLKISTNQRDLAPDHNKTATLYLGWSANTLAPSVHTREGNFLYLTYINFKHIFLQYVVDLPKSSKLPFHKFRSSREVSKEISNGRSVMTLADGPFGPSGVLNMGPVGIARRIGCPIVAIKSDYTCCLKLPFRWDKYKIPLPFSRVNLDYTLVEAEGKSCKDLKKTLNVALGQL
jgi:hypothetical protein